MKTLRFLFSNLGPFSTMFWLLLVTGALDGAAGFSVPILLAEFTKRDVVHRDLTRTIIPLLTFCLVSSLALQWCLRRWAEALQTWFGNELRTKLFKEIETLSMERISLLHSGYISSLINQVAASVGSLTTTILWLVGHIVVTLTLFFVFTARESVGLAYANLFLLTAFIGTSVMLARRMVPRADLVSRTSAVASERFLDFLMNVLTVKKLGVAAWAERHIRSEFAANNRAVAALQRFHAHRWAILHSIFFLSLLITLSLLISRVASGNTSPSILILFIAGFSTVRGHAERLSELIKGILETDAYVARLTTILDRHDIVGVLRLPTLSEIVLRDIRFSHPHSNHEISIPYFRLRPGDRILITGQSGQGKTTLLSIVAHHIIPTHGECLWNGSSYKDYDTSLHEGFAFASQEAELFNLSLRENLRMDCEHSDLDLTTLLRDLGLAEFLSSLPDGLDSKLGEKALRLSAGQKQRVNLARAILLNRPVLLLDEPTSHLDENSERRVLRHLETLPQETAVVVVSHQPAFKAWCHSELVFDSGILRPR